MKGYLKIFVFAFALIFCSVFSGFKMTEPEPLWLSNYDAAITQAEESGNPVLVIFSGSDWCRPCMMLKQNVLDMSEFRNFAERQLILLEVDFPRSRKNKLTSEQLEHNEKLAERFNSTGQFPLVLLLNAEEEIMGKSNDLPLNPDQFIALLESWMPIKE